MGGPTNVGLVVDIRPFWMMLSFLAFGRYFVHEIPGHSLYFSIQQSEQGWFVERLYHVALNVLNLKLLSNPFPPLHTRHLPSSTSLLACRTTSALFSPSDIDSSSALIMLGPEFEKACLKDAIVGIFARWEARSRTQQL